MDIWDKEKRSKVMAQIKSKNTKPELIVRRFLFAHGYRYRLHEKRLPGTPDIVMRKYGLVIFVHGCFWHGHEVDGHLPKSNTAFWEAKISRNKIRDNRCKEQLRQMGWQVMTLWECQLKPAVREKTLNEMLYLINHAYLERFRQKAPCRYVLSETDDAPAKAAEPAAKYMAGKECGSGLPVQVVLADCKK
jgi:DNA mismatch endonuclease (patch repair protein)